jgi:translation initiation factor 2 beta subunit (eIF-2beta)/eIF-5
MDIKKELIALNSSEDFGEALIKDMVKQRENLLKKIHILKTKSIANDLEDKVSIDFFKNIGVHYLGIDLRKEYGNNYKIILHSLNENQQKDYSTISESQKFLYSLFENFQGFSNEFVDDFLKNKLHTNGKLEKGIGKFFLNRMLSDDLKEINANIKFENDSVSELNEQQEKLLKKIYLLSTQSIANKIEEQLSKGFFGEKSKFIGLIYEYDGDKGYEFITGLLDKDENQLVSIKDSDKYTFVNRLFRELDGFSTDFISDNLKGNMRKFNPNIYESEFINKVLLKQGIEDELLNLILSKELKTILDYNKMQLELNNSNESNKRLKM